MIDIVHFDPTGPATTRFDVTACRSRLLALGSTFQDDSYPDYYLVCATAEGAAWARKQRQSTPKRLPSAALAVLRERRITLGARGLEQDHALLEVFAQWIFDTTDCKVSDDDGNDLTKTCAGSAAILFG